MKKTLFLSFFLFSSSYFFGGDSSINCDPKKFLAEDVLEKVLVHRDSAFNICLDCDVSKNNQIVIYYPDTKISHNC